MRAPHRQPGCALALLALALAATHATLVGDPTIRVMARLVQGRDEPGPLAELMVGGGSSRLPLAGRIRTDPGLQVLQVGLELSAGGGRAPLAGPLGSGPADAATSCEATLETSLHALPLATASLTLLPAAPNGDRPSQGRRSAAAGSCVLLDRALRGWSFGSVSVSANVTCAPASEAAPRLGQQAGGHAGLHAVPCASLLEQEQWASRFAHASAILPLPAGAASASVALDIVPPMRPRVGSARLPCPARHWPAPADSKADAAGWAPGCSDVTHPEFPHTLGRRGLDPVPPATAYDGLGARSLQAATLRHALRHCVEHRIAHRQRGSGQSRLPEGSRACGAVSPPAGDREGASRRGPALSVCFMGAGVLDGVRTGWAHLARGLAALGHSSRAVLEFNETERRAITVAVDARAGLGLQDGSEGEVGDDLPFVARLVQRAGMQWTDLGQALSPFNRVMRCVPAAISPLLARLQAVILVELARADAAGTGGAGTVGTVPSSARDPAAGAGAGEARPGGRWGAALRAAGRLVDWTGAPQGGGTAEPLGTAGSPQDPDQQRRTARRQLEEALAPAVRGAAGRVCRWAVAGAPFPASEGADLDPGSPEGLAEALRRLQGECSRWAAGRPGGGRRRKNECGGGSGGSGGSGGWLLDLVEGLSQGLAVQAAALHGCDAVVAAVSGGGSDLALAAAAGAAGVGTLLLEAPRVSSAQPCAEPAAGATAVYATGVLARDMLAVSCARRGEHVCRGGSGPVPGFRGAPAAAAVLAQADVDPVTYCSASPGTGCLPSRPGRPLPALASERDLPWCGAPASRRRRIPVLSLPLGAAAAVGASPVAPARRSGRIRVAVVGSLAFRKSPFLAARIAAASRFSGGTVEVEAHLIGSGRLAGDIRQLAAQLNASDLVRLRGELPHDEAWRWIVSSADAVLAPSLQYETFGMVLAEAMAHGVPLFAFGSELALPGVNAFVIPSPHPVRAAAFIVDRISRLRRGDAAAGAVVRQAAAFADEFLAPSASASRLAGLLQCFRTCRPEHAEESVLTARVGAAIEARSSGLSAQAVAQGRCEEACAGAA